MAVRGGGQATLGNGILYEEKWDYVSVVTPAICVRRLKFLYTAIGTSSSEKQTGNEDWVH